MSLATDPPAGLGGCRIGVVPIIWNNVDVPDLREHTAYGEVLDEIQRLGFDGCQFGAGFPTGPALVEELQRRDLRLAEVYAAIECGMDGPLAGQVDLAARQLDLLTDAGGEVLVMAATIVPERSRHAGRAEHAGTPRLTDSGWNALIDLVTAIGAEARQRGVTAAFHPHTGTFVETPQEVARLARELKGSPVGVCLDTGHYLVGGGDPVQAISDLGDQIHHVHLKDVDPAVLARLRSGEIGDFHDALRARIFTELGNGILDLVGVLAALAASRYDGWLMVEQDTSWGPPSEATAMARRVLAFALANQR